MYNEIKRVCLLTVVNSHVIRSQDGGEVSAVTSLGDEVFVLRERKKQVEVYDTVNCTLQRHITVQKSFLEFLFDHNTRDLAACAHYKCLYVSDCSHIRENYVYRAELIQQCSEEVVGGRSSRSVGEQST